MNFGGVLLRRVDTAGLRDADDEVERLGVERSRAALERAELVFVVTDGSAEFTQEDMEVVRLASFAGKPWIWVMSKRDLTGPCALWNADKDGYAPAAAVSVSALTGQGLDELERAVAALFPEDTGVRPGEMLTNARQAQAAQLARQAVDRAAQALTAGFSPDAVLADVEPALDALGELTGRSVREDVTARIFERFCVGK